MMVIVPRIAVVPQEVATPFLYGVRREGNLDAELLLSDPSETIRLFSAHEADIALIPTTALPSLPEARIITEYCIGASGAVGSPLLVSNTPAEQIRRVFLRIESDPTAAQLCAWACEKHWKITPDYFEWPDREQIRHAEPGDAFLLTGDAIEACDHGCTHAWDLSAEWKKAMRQPFVFALWVAHKEVSPELVEQLQHALTFGLEHGYEALLEAAADTDPVATYERLSHYDYIFDNQKNKALQKFWDLGLKVAPRINPG